MEHKGRAQILRRLFIFQQLIKPRIRLGRVLPQFPQLHDGAPKIEVLLRVQNNVRQLLLSQFVDALRHSRSPRNQSVVLVFPTALIQQLTGSLQIRQQLLRRQPLQLGVHLVKFQLFLL